MRAVNRKRAFQVAAYAIGAGLLCHALLYEAPPGEPLPVAVRAIRSLLPIAYLRIPVAGDFTWPYRAARHVLEGVNPYLAIEPLGLRHYPFDAYFYYPLPMALVVLPVAALPPKLAAALSFGAAFGLLAWAMLRRGFSPLPLFFSPMFLMCAHLAQIGPPLAMAGALIPELGALLLVKPNLGLAMWLYRPSWRAVFSAAAVLAVSLLVLPSWPLDWFHTLRQHHHLSPIRFLVYSGPLLGLAALRLAEARGRLLFSMAALPQVLDFYDQLALALIPRSRRQTVLLLLVWWGTWFVWRSYRDAYFSDPHSVGAWTALCVGYGVFFPALAALLWPRAGLRATLRAAARRLSFHQS